MSRVGKLPVAIPAGVTVEVTPTLVKAKGKLGELTTPLVSEVEVIQADGAIQVNPKAKDGRSRAMWGMIRNNIFNIVKGVAEGYEKRLEIQGVGYRAAVAGDYLTLNLGYSHDIKFAIPAGITVKCEKPTLISVSGADKQKVGQVAAEIRAFRKPEPYKGKGIRYEGEHVLSKEGKKK